jgi:phage tail-like protein
VPPFTVNPHRFDPYKRHKFRVRWDGRYVAGVSRVGPLRRVTEVVEHRSGADPTTTRKSPGRTEFAPLVLERGVTHDPEFEQWADRAWRLGAGLGMEAALRNFRKDLVVELLNEAGQVVLSYKVYRCWVSEYEALPVLDAADDGVAFERIVVQNEGWERDRDVAEPAEP